MTGRQLRAIFAALALLVALYVGTRLLAGGRATYGGGPHIGAVVGPDLDAVLIVEPGAVDSIRLHRTPAGWTVNGYPADSARVEQALADLADARPGRLVARSSANHARLGVVDDSARRIVLTAGGSRALEFLLGKGGADGRYVRQPASDEVYTVPTASVAALLRPPDEWRDRRIAAVDTAALIRMVIRRGTDSRPIELMRRRADSTAAWVESGSAVDPAVMGSLLDAVADLQASGFPSDSVAFAVDFAAPESVLELYESAEPAAAPRLALLFAAAPDASGYLVRRASNPLVYRLAAGTVGRLLPGREALQRGD